MCTKDKNKTTQQTHNNNIHKQETQLITSYTNNKNTTQTQIKQNKNTTTINHIIKQHSKDTNITQHKQNNISNKNYNNK